MNAPTSSAAAEKSLPVESDVEAEISQLLEENIPKRPPEIETEVERIRSSLVRLTSNSIDGSVIRHLAQADRHIVDLKAHIVRQRVILKHALDTGQPSDLAESLLQALEESLSIFEKHRKLILERMRRP
jgi:hypothetical protein